MERSGFLFTLLAVYSLGITFYALGRPKINALCTRDFVEPSAQGTCLCGEGAYCLCTPSLASDILIELENEAGKVEKIVFIERKE